jgi:hypothetical protein
MKLKILLIAGLLLFALIALPAYASGGNCPAFNSSMIDAAFLATDFSQQNPLVGSAEDSPADARIACYLETDAEAVFLLFVGICEGECGAGAGKGEAQLIGLSPDDMAPGADYSTQLRTRVFSLTRAEQHACRAQVLASFTWNQHCKPLMQ